MQGNGKPAVRRARFGENGSTQKLCEFDQLVDRTRFDNAAAGENGRVFRRCQDGSRPFQLVDAAAARAGSAASAV